jgi:hypothetical protein
MTVWIRQFHRWLSIVFALAVVVNVAAQMRHVQEIWIGLLALAPLFALLFTGLYLFALPYALRRRSTRRVAG